MQKNLLPKNEMKNYKRYTHGGVSLKKRRKVERPLYNKRITHTVFKSSKAVGSLSFYKHRGLISNELNRLKKRFFIEVLDFVNMGNHLHLKVRFRDKDRFKKFLKAFAGVVARKITGARKGRKFGRFWDGLVYTRVLFSSFEEYGLKGYFEANHRQREYGYEERVLYLKRFNQYLYRLKAMRASPIVANPT